MAIRGVVFDISNTLLDSTGVPFPGISDLLSFCTSRNLLTAAVTNRYSEFQRLRKSSLALNCVYYPKGLNPAWKPSPLVLDAVCSYMNLNRTEIIYIGDTDKSDAYMAASGRVLFFRSRWGGDNGIYGIPAESPLFIQYFLDTFLLKTHLWHWTLDEKDEYGRDICARGIMHGFPPDNVDPTIKRASLGIFKFRNHFYRGYIPFFLNHLLASLYVDGFAAQADLWAPYPGSKPGSGNHVFLPQYTLASKLFHGDFYNDLIVRHARAMDSGEARITGKLPTFGNQVNTVLLGGNYEGRLMGKTVIVLDDFVTEGFSFECARNLLLEAGAQSVVSACVARYPPPYKIFSLRSGADSAPFVEDPHADSRYECDRSSYGTYVDNSQEIDESFKKFKYYKSHL